MILEQGGPCGPMATGMHAFIIVMNVVQSVLIAYISTRTYRKNREETNGKQRRSEEP